MIDKPRYFDALSELVNGSEGLTGGSTDGPMSEIGFVSGISKPTESEVQTKLDSMISDWDAQAYARNRAAAYDSVGNQLDMLMKDMKNNTTTHQESCEAVKARFPKPE